VLRRIFYLSIFFVSLNLFAGTELFAQRVARGTPSIYKVTMIKLEMSQNSGTTWFTVADSQLELDIASVEAGQKAGDWVSNVSLPIGTYNRMRHTVSATFKMRGYAYYNTTNRTYFTTPNGISNVVGNVTDTSQMPSYGEQSITISEGGEVSGGRVVHEEEDNIAISADAPMRERVTFDVTNTLDLYQEGVNYVFYPAPPVVDSIPQ
jgi:hypothetical protein